MELRSRSRLANAWSTQTGDGVIGSMCHRKRRILSDAIGAGYPDFYGVKHAVWVSPVGLARGWRRIARSTVSATGRTIAGSRILTLVCMICINPKLNLPLHNDAECAGRRPTEVSPDLLNA